MTGANQKRCACGEPILGHHTNVQYCPDCKEEQRKAWRRQYLRDKRAKGKQANDGLQDRR
jgi:hypothetical protein